ncbi:MAG: hypothetical protein LBU37_09495 [Tannerellaceae bacterium]|jgi:hypothetical protein|nr:hypothetical protein [Tannerellaceae bacterium]
MDKEFFMNYAEGQGASTVKYDNETEAINEAERLAEKLGVEVTTLKAVTKTTPKDIAKSVKTYADACAIIGIEPIVDEVLLKLGFAKDEIAYRKLKTIAKALNEGWEPDWTNSNQNKYWPWFLYNPNSAGLSCALTAHAASHASTSIGSRLCFKTHELAAYARENFRDLYFEYLFIDMPKNYGK